MAVVLVVMSAMARRLRLLAEHMIRHTDAASSSTTAAAAAAVASDDGNDEDDCARAQHPAPVDPPPPRLSAAEVRHFRERGFLVVHGLFGAAEADKLREAADEVLAESRNGAPRPRRARQSLLPFFEHSNVLRPLLTDDRIYGLACELLGPNPTLNASEGNLHVGGAVAKLGGADSPRPCHPLTMLVESRIELLFV